MDKTQRQDVQVIDVGTAAGPTLVKNPRRVTSLVLRLLHNMYYQTQLKYGGLLVA